MWHCDREGGYSLYSDGVTEENYLRGVQITDADRRSPTHASIRRRSERVAVPVAVSLPRVRASPSPAMAPISKVELLGKMSMAGAPGGTVSSGRGERAQCSKAGASDGW